MIMTMPIMLELIPNDDCNYIDNILQIMRVIIEQKQYPKI